MKSATQVIVSTFGGYVGLMGIEHGLGEVLQGNVAPNGTMILSWPTSKFFEVLAGEPAMTIIPNLLVTGILAILFSLMYVVWAIGFAQRKHGGLVLMMLSVIMLPVGAGIFPPILGMILGVIATTINAPLTWWRAHLSTNLCHFLETLWPWSFSACLISWLGMFPGIVLLWHLGNVDNSDLTMILLLCMFVFLFSTVVTGWVRDSQKQTGLSASTSNEAQSQKSGIVT